LTKALTLISPSTSSSRSVLSPSWRAEQNSNSIRSSINSEYSSLAGRETACTFSSGRSRSHRYTGPLFRALEHVLVSPGIHHTHHGFGRDGKNYRNFGTVVSLYDWMFGTLHIPQGRPANYGLPVRDAHWLEQLFYPLVRMPVPARQPVQRSET
jgi:hypothetical protein